MLNQHTRGFSAGVFTGVNFLLQLMRMGHMILGGSLRPGRSMNAHTCWDGWIAALLLVVLISVSLVLFLVSALWTEVLRDRRRAALDFLPIAITQNTPF